MKDNITACNISLFGNVNLLTSNPTKTEDGFDIEMCDGTMIHLKYNFDNSYEKVYGRKTNLD